MAKQELDCPQVAGAPVDQRSFGPAQRVRPVSGGGAKGSFQIGAIAYFSRERWSEVEPDIIVGTSVGSVNALGLAEGALDGIVRMERVWLGLRTESDMYEDSIWWKKIKELIGQLQGLSEYARPEAIVPGVLLGGTVGGALGLLIGASANLADDVPELIDRIKQMKWLYDLKGTRELVLQHVRFDRIPLSGKKLRLTSICLEDGLVYHVTENGQIVSDIGRDPPFVGEMTGTLAKKLTDGAMASAGIPAIFPYLRAAVTANGSVRNMTLVDGGVREVLPIRTASELGAQFIIAVSCSPNRVTPFVSLLSGDTITQFGNETIMNIALRAVDLATREVTQNEVTPDGGFCDDVDRVFVVPSFEVHSTQQIDPGLLLINMAHGYMRAFEMYARYREAVNGLQLFLAIEFNDQIITARKQIWELEEKAFKLVDEVNGARSVPDIDPGEVGSYRAAEQFFDRPMLDEIRRLKREVLDLVVGRVMAFSAESVPKRFDDPTIGYANPIRDWWNNWERHKEPLDSLLRAFDPWTALPIRVRFLVRNEVGVPEQIFEGSAPVRPALPPDLAQQLA